MTEDQTPIPQTQGTVVPWADWQKQLAVLVLIILVPVTFYLLRPVLYPLIYLFLGAFILRYPIKLLQTRLKLSYRVSVLIVYLIFVVVVFWAVFGLLSTLAGTAVSMFNGIELALNALIPAPTAVSIGPFDLSPILQPLQKMATIGGAIKLLSSSGDIINRLTSVLGLLASFFKRRVFCRHLDAVCAAGNAAHSQRDRPVYS